MKLTQINTQIFREYDIRGIWGDDITEDVAYTMGRSFGSYIREKYNVDDVIIGRDNRTSGPTIIEALIKGLTESGAHVIDLGVCTSPMYYFAKKKYQINNYKMTKRIFIKYLLK